MATTIPDIILRSRSDGLRDFDAPTEVVEGEKAEYKTELSTLEEEIKATRAYLQGLEARASHVQQALGLWTVALRSPIRRLPPELLSRIFVFSCWDEYFYLTMGTGTNPELPRAPTSHAIVRVSKYWRHVAKETPQIWDHWVMPITLSKADIPAILNLYGRNLTRVYHTTETCIVPLLQAGQSIRSLRLVEWGLTLLRDVDGLLEMPLLEDLLISYPEEAEEEEEEEVGEEDVLGNVLPIVFNTPRLRKLSLYFPTDVLSRFVLPWDQITHFSYGPSPPLNARGRISSNLLEVLQRLPNLTYLHFIAGLNIQLIRPQHITLSNLRVLEINDHSLRLLNTRTQPGILGCLRAPLLERFDLIIPTANYQSGIEPYNYASQQLTSFFRTSSQLQQIRIALMLLRDALTTFIGPGTTSQIFHVSGKAPVFRDLYFPPITDIVVEVPDQVKILYLPKPTPVDGFYILDRFIDRFLKHDDNLERTPGDRWERFIFNSELALIKRPCDMLSGFSDDDLNMELYIQFAK